MALVDRRKYADDPDVIQAGLDAFDSTYATEIGSGETALQARKLAKTACQAARVAAAQALVDAE